jgi:hypothetical protein
LKQRDVGAIERQRLVGRADRHDLELADRLALVECLVIGPLVDLVVGDGLQALLLHVERDRQLHR